MLLFAFSLWLSSAYLLDFQWQLRFSSWGRLALLAFEPYCERALSNQDEGRLCTFGLVLSAVAAGIAVMVLAAAPGMEMG